MRAAVFALTEQGAVLAKVIKQAVPQAVAVFLPERMKREYASEDWHFFSHFGSALQESFSCYDALVCIMATGIVVRTLAPLLKDKLADPAVVVCDERGSFAISLLSGHVGGGNFFTRQLAEAIGAQPVITTATDVEGRLAPDAFAGQLALLPWPKTRIKTINKALLEREKIDYLVSPSLSHRNFYVKELVKWQLPYREKAEYSYHVCLCPREELPEEHEVPDKTLYLTPPRLIAGVGCRRNVPKELVWQALENACQKIGRDISFLYAMASVSVKADEAGLLAAARELEVAIEFYEAELLQQRTEEFHLHQSCFVKRQVGTGNVCEAAAICEGLRHSERIRFALPKTKYEQVTVALLWCW